MKNAKYIFLTLIISSASLSVGCNFSAQTMYDSHPESAEASAGNSSNQGDLPGGATDGSPTFSEDRVVYQRNCASCHQDLESTTKRNRSASQIREALNSVQAMRFLSLSESEVNAIERALSINLIPPPNPDSDSPLSATKFAMSLGHGDYVREKLNDIFQSESSPQSYVRGTIANNIPTRFDFGGPCTSRDNLQTGSIRCQTRERDVEVQHFATSSTVRKGYTTRVCRLVLARDSSVLAALENVGLTVDSLPNDENLSQVFDIFAPGRFPSETVIESLRSIYESGKAQGFSNIDAWRFLFVPLCISSVMEMN